MRWLSEIALYRLGEKWSRLSASLFSFAATIIDTQAAPLLQNSTQSGVYTIARKAPRLLCTEPQITNDGYSQ